MTIPADYIDWMTDRQGVPYLAQNPERFGPDFFDCSGFVASALKEAGVPSIGTTSWQMARACGAAGLGLEIAAGIATRGALLFCGPNGGADGFGASGHVAVSLGDGTVVETPSFSGGWRATGISPATINNWSGAALIPGVDYGYDHDRDRAWLGLGSRGMAVRRLQAALIAAGCPLPNSTNEDGTTDGDFGVETLAGLQAFQEQHGLTVTGNTDALTWDALEAFLVAPTPDDDLPPDADQGPDVPPVVEPTPDPVPDPTPDPVPAPIPDPLPPVPEPEPPVVDPEPPEPAVLYLSRADLRRVMENMRHRLELRIPPKERHAIMDGLRDDLEQPLEQSPTSR